MTWSDAVGVADRAVAVSALGFVPPSRVLQPERLMTVWTWPRILTICRLEQLAASPAHKYVCRVPHVLGEKKVWEQIRFAVARITVRRLHPKEIFHTGFVAAAIHAFRAVQ